MLIQNRTTDKFFIDNVKDHMGMEIIFTNDNHWLYRVAFDNMPLSDKKDIIIKGIGIGTLPVSKKLVKNGNHWTIYDKAIPNFEKHLRHMFMGFFTSKEYKHHGNHAKIMRYSTTQRAFDAKAKKCGAVVNALRAKDNLDVHIN